MVGGTSYCQFIIKINNGQEYVHICINLCKLQHDTMTLSILNILATEGSKNEK
jgi:hypothetical protein